MAENLFFWTVSKTIHYGIPGAV